MTLIVARVSDAFYTAMASPPHAREKWRTRKPLRINRLLDQLLALGVQQTDAVDAISNAARAWLPQALNARRNPKPGDQVILKERPGSFEDLPEPDQQKISAIIGKPVQLHGYDDNGRAMLLFTDADGELCYIFVSPELIGVASRRWQRERLRLLSRLIGT